MRKNHRLSSTKDRTGSRDSSEDGHFIICTMMDHLTIKNRQKAAKKVQLPFEMDSLCQFSFSFETLKQAI